MKRIRPLIIVIMLFLLMPIVSPAADWPQLQNTPQRTGYSTEKIDVPYTDIWIHGFSPDRLHAQVQPVVVGGKLYIGTERGVFYQFDAPTGSVLHTFAVPGGGSILHTAAVSASNGLAVFGDMDGKVYALRTTDLSLAWTFDSGKLTGFSTAVLMVEDKITPANTRFYISNRDGTVYSLDPNGAQVWQRALGAPVLMSSCFDIGADGVGRIFVPAMNMTLSALRAADGTMDWQKPARGAALKDYSPVAYRGNIFMRVMVLDPNDVLNNVVLTATNTLTAAEISQQTNMVSTLQSQPNRKDLFVFDQVTGNEPYVVPQWSLGMHGATLPPTVDGDGEMIVPAIVQDWRYGWGRLKLDYVDPSDGLVKPRVVERLWDGNFVNGNPSGSGNGDENMTVSAAGRLVFVLHINENSIGAQYSGMWHLDRKQWTPIDLFVGNNADKNLHSSTESNAPSAAAISGGMVFKTTWETNLYGRKFTTVP